MKHNTTLLITALSLMYAHGFIHGMEQDLDSIKKQIETNQARITKQLPLEERQKLLQENYKLLESLVNKSLPKNETFIIPSPNQHYVSSSQIEQPSIIRTINDDSLITILHVKYDNKYQYTALTNFSLFHVILEENQEKQQHKIKESCQQVLQDLAANSKVIAANFFLITSDDPNGLEFYKEHISSIKNIIKTNLENMTKITTLEYDHKNFKYGDIILTLCPDTAKLKIGNITHTDL
ncbi:MAG TPA: hypothetical protein VHX42_00240 [Candidatus Babeliales bacterium]|jgi:hypothetical protein|nr:hypothetical protein [Candidatus Babeliales bacterium]